MKPALFAAATLLAASGAHAQSGFLRDAPIGRMAREDLRKILER